MGEGVGGGAGGGWTEFSLCREGLGLEWTESLPAYSSCGVTPYSVDGASLRSVCGPHTGPSPCPFGGDAMADDTRTRRNKNITYIVQRNNNNE